MFFGVPRKLNTFLLYLQNRQVTGANYETGSANPSEGPHGVFDYVITWPFF